MDLRKEEFPVALQAYEVRGEKEDFLAEQVVNSQVEADRFMSLYAGRLIKTREVRPMETKRYGVRKRHGSLLWVIILAVIVVLLIAGFATGWIQTMLGQSR